MTYRNNATGSMFVLLEITQGMSCELCKYKIDLIAKLANEYRKKQSIV